LIEIALAEQSLMEELTVADETLTNAAKIIPGSEILGRGIYIRPRQPYLLKKFLFQTGQQNTQTHYSHESNIGNVYSVPEGCAVNTSPPMPSDQSLGQTVVEESWDRFGKEVAFNANAVVSGNVATIDATAFQASSLRTEEESYYALRSSFVPFWEVYMPQPRIDEEALKAIEDQIRAPFDPDDRERYTRIFEIHGTHYVRRAWVGGKASLVFVVSKSSKLTKEDVKVGVQVTLAEAAHGEASKERKETQDRLRSNSSCKVFGSGGDPTTLAKLTNLDANAYNEWLGSVKNNPEVIQIGIAGIWTLLTDPQKAEALKQAYIRESRFTQLTATVPIGIVLLFIKDDEVFDYCINPYPGRPRANVLSYLYNRAGIKDEVRHDLKQKILTQHIGLNKKEDVIDFLNKAILSSDLLCDNDSFKKFLPPPDDLDRHSLSPIHIIRLNRKFLDKAFPELPGRPARLSLADYCPVLRADNLETFQRPHAAFSLYGFGEERKNEIHLFKWRFYLRLRLNGDVYEVVKGYPRHLQMDWPDVDFVRLDAAVPFAPDRVYFFSGPEYIRIGMTDGKPVDMERKLIKSGWPGVVFEKIDTAVYWGSSKIYFFYEDQYIRYDMKIGRADPGYPKFLSSDYVEDWELFG
jgi:hypothetical protein